MESETFFVVYTDAYDSLRHASFEFERALEKHMNLIASALSNERDARIDVYALNSDGESSTLLISTEV